MAKLPITLLKEPERTLCDLEVGETAFLHAAAMLVTPAHDCYLIPEEKVNPEKSIFHILRVTRKADGYHVSILSRMVKWNPDATRVSTYVPVASVAEEIDPEVDLSSRGR